MCLPWLFSIGGHLGAKEIINIFCVECEIRLALEYSNSGNHSQNLYTRVSQTGIYRGRKNHLYEKDKKFCSVKKSPNKAVSIHLLNVYKNNNLI